MARKRAGRMHKSRADLEQQLEKYRHELAEAQEHLSEALEQQSATSEVLKVISRSAFDLQLVLDTLVESAVRLCDADHAWLFQREGEFFRWVTSFGHATDVRAQLRDYFKPRKVPVDRGSITGRAAMEARVVHVPDVLADSEYTWSGAQKIGGYRAALGAPLLRNGSVVGVLFITRNAPLPFSPKHSELIETFAGQAVIAIENTRLFEAEQASKRELQESLEYQSATSDVLNVISRSQTDVQPVLESIAKSAAQLCNAQFCHVFRFDGQLIHFTASHGQPLEQIEAIRKVHPIAPGRVSAAARAILSGKIEEIPDIHTDPDYQHGRTANFSSVVAVPMLKDGRPIGAIAMARSETGSFPERQVEMLKTFADQAVIAIENTRLFEEVQKKNHALSEAHAQVSGALERETATSEILRVIGTSPTDVLSVFETIARSGVSVCGALGCVVFVVDGDMIRVAASHGVRPERLERFRSDYPVPLSAEIDTARTIRQRCMFHLADIENNPNATATDIAHARLGGYRTRLMIPMVRADRTLGLIAVTREDPTPFPDQLVKLLKTFAGQAVIAIENTRLFEAEQASKRELTEALEQQTATSEVLKIISS